jgi:two-component system cell cycle sensor histidine kinase/response regulator CckA
VVVGRDFDTEPMLAPWREEALRRGYTSSTALPIAYGGERVGVLTMYSGDVRVFGEEEQGLLQRLAEDLGYGVVSLRRQVERDLAERALRESQQSLRALFDLSPDATAVSRARDGVILDVNNSFLAMTGWSRDEVIGRSTGAIGIWGDPADREKLVGRIEKGEVVRNFQARLRDRAGAPLEVLVSARLLTYAGEPAILVLARDVTEVNRNARRYQLLADHARDVIWTLDLATQRFTYVSPAIRQLRGITPEQAMAESIEESLTPESLARATASMSRRAGSNDEGISHVGVFDQPCADGSIKHVEITTSYVRNEEGRAVEVLGVSRDATARVEAELALERRERELRTILQTAIDGFVSLEGDGSLVDVNEAYCSLTGYSREELLGMKVADIDVLDVPAEIAARLAHIQESGSDRFETRYRRRDGRVIDVEVSVRFSPAEEVRFHAFVRDVTQRKRSEAELRESQQRLATIVRVTQTGFLVTRISDRRIIDANDAWLEQVGWSREEALGRTTRDLGLFLDDALPGTVYEAIRADGSTGPVEVQLRRRSGEITDYVINAGLAELGGERCAISAWHDVTALHRADAALRENEARFRTLIERSSDLIVLLDASGRTTFWSPSAVESLGFLPEEAIGLPFLDLVRSDDQESLADALTRNLAEPGSTERIVLRVQRKGAGWRTLEGLCRNLLSDPAVGALVLNLRDVTEHQQLEEQFRQAQRLESIGRLAGGVAHDFNNLLTVILSCSEAMKHDRADGREIDPEDISEIHDAGERARDLTRQLLAFARKQVIAPVPLDLNAVVRGSEKLLLRIMGEDVRLVVRLAPGLWPTMCDTNQVEQVLLNLAANARDAMPGGGALEIETRNVGPGDGDGRALPGHLAGDWVQVVVKDTGSGMTPEVIDHLFEPFFTTKEHGRGTGLGLATVHGIVAQSGGHIQVESEVARGTTFRLFFPRTGEPHSPRQPEPAPGTPRGHETVLVVEDDSRVRAVTVRALAEQGYTVLPAGGGDEALALARNCARAIDLVVTDVVMPGMSGREVVDRLREGTPGLRALFVSGYTQDAIARRGVLDSGVEFLPKPFTAATLVARVRAVLDAGRLPG